MKSSQAAPKDIDEYIAGYPEGVREILESIRLTIREAAPDAEEAIKYQMPSFTLHGNLIHFAAFKRHIGLYPAPRDAEEFKDELAGYAGEKGTVRFSFNEPIPLDLISRIVRFRVEQRLDGGAAKRTKRA